MPLSTGREIRARSRGFYRGMTCPKSEKPQVDNHSTTYEKTKTLRDLGIQGLPSRWVAEELDGRASSLCCARDLDHSLREKRDKGSRFGANRSRNRNAVLHSESGPVYEYVRTKIKQTQVPATTVKSKRENT